MALGKQLHAIDLERCVANVQPHQPYDKCAYYLSGKEIIYAGESSLAS